MKTTRIALGLTVLTMMVLFVPAAFACEPGLSPGFWKHDVRAYVEGRGRLHFSPAEMEQFEAYIIANIDGAFTLEWANMAFWNKDYKHMWLDIANYFNEAAGLDPYQD